jgi:hypothetical protein
MTSATLLCAHTDQLWGPLLICAAMFIAILTNFIVRVREMYVSVDAFLRWC